MIGVSVIVDGTSIGGVTDLDGNFTITNVPANAFIKVSYIGYKEQRLPVGNRNTLNITMQEDNQTLDELVVVGYGVVKKSDLTGAVGSIHADDIVAKGSTNLAGGLQGSIAGVKSHSHQAVRATASPCRFVVKVRCKVANHSM